MIAPVVYLIIGCALLLGIILPTLTDRRPVSSAMVLLGVGALVGLLPLPASIDLEPTAHPDVVRHLTEVTVLIALTGVGLALDRPLCRVLDSWRRWSAVWRLLFIGMPLAIAAATLTGHWLLGLAPGVALLLASALAPTDPVLAADVQVGGPTTEVDNEEIDEDDEVRFALTAEAGLNDGAAFPFVYAALAVIGGTTSTSWWLKWIGWDLVGKTAIGIAVGWLVGIALARLAFAAPRSIRVAHLGDPLLIVAVPFVAYGLTELLHGWGFVSVFVCAITLRAGDRSHSYHDEMHGVIERLERLATLLLLLLLGAALTNGMLEELTWQGALFGILMVFLIRPVTAWIALWSKGARDFTDDGRLGPRERLVTSFFGVRGIGTLFYLAYATSGHDVPHASEIWAVAGFTIALSVVVHGVLASPIVDRLDARRDAAEA